VAKADILGLTRGFLLDEKDVVIIVGTNQTQLRQASNYERGGAGWVTTRSPDELEQCIKDLREESYRVRLVILLPESATIKTTADWDKIKKICGPDVIITTWIPHQTAASTKTGVFSVPSTNILGESATAAPS